MKGGVSLSKKGVLLGKDVETNKDIWLERVYRKLNTLILGSAGSEKKQNVMYPFIKQDMKNKDGGITVFDPIGDIAEVAHVLAKRNRRKTFYFQPFFKNVKFNPLKGSVDDVCERFSILVKTQFIDSPQFFKDVYETLLLTSIHVLKEIHGDEVTLQDLNDFLHNTNEVGTRTFKEFLQLKDTGDFDVSHCTQMLEDYFTPGSKMYELGSGLRTMINKLLANQTLSRLFNTKEEGEYTELDFPQHIRNKEVVIIDCQLHKLGTETGRVLATLLSSAYASAVFAQEEKRESNYLYIEELYYFLNSLLYHLFVISEKYNLSVVGSSQSILLLTLFSEEFQNHSEMILPLFRNLIVTPGISVKDMTILREHVLSEEEINSLHALKVGEFFYRIIDMKSNICFKSGRVKGKPFSELESHSFKEQLRQYLKKF
jgi:hypothetical protein